MGKESRFLVEVGVKAVFFTLLLVPAVWMLVSTQARVDRLELEAVNTQLQVQQLEAELGAQAYSQFATPGVYFWPVGDGQGGLRIGIMVESTGCVVYAPDKPHCWVYLRQTPISGGLPEVEEDAGWETPCRDGWKLWDPDDEVRMTYWVSCTEPSVPEKALVSDDGAWETPYRNGVRLLDPDGEVGMVYQTAPMPEPPASTDPSPAVEEDYGCDHPWCCTLPGNIRGHYCLPISSVPYKYYVPDEWYSHCYDLWAYGIRGCSGEFIPGLAPYWLGVVCYGQGPCGSGYAWCYVNTWSHHCGGCWCN